MKQIFTAGVLAALAGTLPAAAIEEKGQARPGPQAVGYTCVDHSRKGTESDIVMTPPLPNFKCPPGKTLFLVTKQLMDQVAAAPQTEVPEAGPTPAPGTPVPKKASKKQRCVPTYGGMYCCSGDPPRNCKIK